MATSGEYTAAFTLNDAIVEAYEELQTTASGESLDGTLFTQALNTLNRMLKQWESYGIHLWTFEEYSLFFVPGQAGYDFNNAATRVVNKFYQTTLAADEVATDTSILVDSTANMAIGQAIGVLDNNGVLMWSVIERLPGAGVVQLRDALTEDAATGCKVRFYDTKKLGTTTLSASEIATDTDVELTSVEGLEVGFNIGITADDDSVLWTTVNAIDTTTRIVTLNAALVANSAATNDVIFFESEQNFIPVARIHEVRRHDGLTEPVSITEAVAQGNGGYEIPINFESREDYFNLPNKTQRGTVIQAYYSRQEPQGVMYCWNTPASALEYMNFTAERQIQIMESDADQEFDIPAYWRDALVMNLAKKLINKVGCSAQRRVEIREDAMTTLDLALSFDSDVYPVKMVPKRYG